MNKKPRFGIQAQQVLAAYADRVSEDMAFLILECNVASGWADQNSTVPGVVVGCWNESLLKPVQKLLEWLGYETGYPDDTAICEQCNRAVSTVAQHHGWKPGYMIIDVDLTSGLYCASCLKTHYAEDLVRHCLHRAHACAFEMDWSAHGLVKAYAQLEVGIREGQTLSVPLLKRELKRVGVNRYVFQVDDAEQFSETFSIWVQPEDLDAVKSLDWSKTQTADAASRLRAAVVELRAQRRQAWGG